MEQHLEALERANEIRFARAELKRALKEGNVGGAEVLLGQIPEWLRAMRLEEFCRAIPRFSRRSYQRVMQEVGAGLTLTIGGLTSRQRTALGEALAVWEIEAAERRAAGARRESTRQEREARRLRNGLGMAA